ncbi:helix-turn-helix domain-containing protein [Nonomuraea sp. NPDC050328]|uniref:helix-turn-helix domain-containing protein n=1 Tax=Nonomuraea sp. NPDC050328 TaxID=3364361 RepID=UPI0037B65753
MTKYLTIQQTCEQIERSRWTVRRLIKAGVLKAEKRGHHVFITADSVRAYRRTHRAPLAEAS